jgi:hypothetical protein
MIRSLNDNRRLQPFVSILVLGMLVLIMSACNSVKNYHLEILHPAQITIQPEIKTAVLIDNSFPIKDSVKVLVEHKSEQYIHEVVDTFSTIAIRKLYKTLNDRSFFDSVSWHQKQLNILPYGYKNKPLQIDTLRKIKAQTNADLAIVLSDYNYTPCLTYSEVIEGLKLYNITLYNKAQLTWSLIDLNSFKIIDVYRQIDSLSWTSQSERLYYPTEGLPSVKESEVSVADYLGFYYANHLTPWWEPKDRNYYSGGGYYKLADEYVAAKNFAAAEKVWFHYYQSKKKIVKARAAHNIALARELQGDIEGASKWAFESYTLFKSLSVMYQAEIDQANEYYLELCKRLLDAKKLVNQIGG